MFKAACPRSYSYAYDDPTSTFTCAGADYTVTFCPSLPSQKSSRDMSPPATTASTTTGANAYTAQDGGNESISGPVTESGYGYASMSGSGLGSESDTGSGSVSGTGSGGRPSWAAPKAQNC